MGFPGSHTHLSSGRKTPAAVSVVAFALVTIGSMVKHANAQASADEAAIRAAMVLNIARFTEWPPAKMDADHPQMIICILGTDPIDAYADKLLDHQVIQDKPTLVRRLKPSDSVESCHVLYTSVADRKWTPRSQDEIERGAVLSISELSNNFNTAQVVGLPASGDHIHIEINLRSAARSKLHISSRILRLATVTQ